MIQELQRIAARLRIRTIQTIASAGAGNTAFCMSAVELFSVLYFGVINRQPFMKLDPAMPQWTERDFFVAGNHHSAPLLYAVLAEKGFISDEDLYDYRKVNSLLQAYPGIKVPGIDAPMNHLNAGLSLAVAIALSLQMDKKKNKVFCVISDYQLQSGIVWEAALQAAQHKLDNLVLLIDRNRFQADGGIAQIVEIDPIFEKFSSFGWNPLRIADGHNFDFLIDALMKASKVTRKPSVLICNTVYGKGIPFVENKPYYQGSPLSEMEIAEALPYLEKIAYA